MISFCLNSESLIVVASQKRSAYLQIDPMPRNAFPQKKKSRFWFCIWRSLACFDNSTLASLASLTSVDVNVCLNSAASTGSLSSANEQWRLLVWYIKCTWRLIQAAAVETVVWSSISNGWITCWMKQRLEAKYPTTPTIWTRPIVKLTMGPCWWQPSVFTVTKQPDVLLALYVYYTCSTCRGSKSDMPWSGAVPSGYIKPWKLAQTCTRMSTIVHPFVKTLVKQIWSRH